MVEFLHIYEDFPNLVSFNVDFGENMKLKDELLISILRNKKILELNVANSFVTLKLFQSCQTEPKKAKNFNISNV